MNPKSHANPECQRFWQNYAQLGQFAKRGMFGPALQLIQNLWQHPKRLEFDPDRKVDYTFAILTLQVPSSRGDIENAISILRSILAKPAASTNLRPIKIELAAALIRVGALPEALTTAKEVVSSALHPEPLAYQNLGRAHFELGNLNEAEKAHLDMIEASLRTTEISLTGIAAEWLSRIELRRGNQSRASLWCQLANDVYREYSPHYLESLRDVLKQVDLKSNLDVRNLPPQGAEIRRLVPKSGELGSRAGDHMDDLYVDLGNLGLGLVSTKGRNATLTIPMPVGAEQTHIRVAGLLDAEVKSLLPHSWTLDVLDKLVRELWPVQAGHVDLENLMQDRGNWKYIPATSANQLARLVWNTSDMTAAVYGLFVHSLALLYLMAYESRRSSLEKFRDALNGDASFLQLIDLSARAWPRPIDRRFVAYGQGLVENTIGVAELAGEVTRKRLMSSEINRKSFEKINFTSKEADELDKGGLIALFATEIATPGALPPSFIGTTPLNEVNAANLPPKVPFQPDLTKPGFVIDREYNTWFFAPSSKDPDRACYGSNNGLLRDHFTPFQEQVNIVGTVRAKHFAIPIVDVPDPLTLKRIVKLLDASTERLKLSKHVPENARMMYRGQCMPYALKRSQTVIRFLYGQTNVSEPSLPGAAPRRGWNYHKVHSFLSTMLQGLIYRNAASMGETLAETHQRWARFASKPGDWDLGVMLLAQHYGIPTHGIDITSDPDVALWFATNRFTPLADGTATYRMLLKAAWDGDASTWPVIYVILPVTLSLQSSIRDVDLLRPLGIEARRPIAQKASFFMGADGLHRNRLAEALVCVLRLGPAEWDSKNSYTNLFPAPNDDKVYSWMLDLRARHAQGEIGKFLAEIPRYSYE